MEENIEDKGENQINIKPKLRRGGTKAALKYFKDHEKEGILSLNAEYPNAVARRYLAMEWKKLSPEDQILLRAKRTKRGIKCDICGLAGYFRENCPNECVSPPSTPDSRDNTPREKKKKKKKFEEESQPKLQYLDFTADSNDEQSMLSNEKSITVEQDQQSQSTQSVGVFWGNQSKVIALAEKKAKEEKKKQFPSSSGATSGYNEKGELSASVLKEKVDLSDARPKATQRLEELRESDKKLGHFSFYSLSELNYNRNHAEMTLQQVMRRVIRLLQTQLKHNTEELESTFDVTLLNPPANKVSKHFYPEELKDDPILREYYIKKEAMYKNEQLSYRHQGALRPVDDLDVLFRGKDMNYSSIYNTKKNAGESIHAKNTWKSILAKNDTLANSDPALIRRQEKINKLFENQSKWIKLQSMDMKYRNDRFEHLVYIIQSEIEKEHSRESKLLLTLDNKPIEKGVALDLWQERLNAVDLMIKVLQAYKFTAGLEEADFLLFCLNAWQKECQKKSKPGAAAVSTSNNPNPTEAQGVSSTVSAQKPTLQKQSTASTVQTMATAQTTSTAESATVEEDADDEGKIPMSLTDLKNKRKNKSKSGDSVKSNTNFNKRDLIAAATNNPYYQDIQFLNATKKKHDKMFLKGKTGTVFTAQRHREEMEKKKEEQEKFLSDLETQQIQKSVESIVSTKSKPVISALNPHEFDHDQDNLATGRSSSSIGNPSPLRRQSSKISFMSIDGAVEKSTVLEEKELISLPSLEEIANSALKHKEEIEIIEEKKKQQRERMNFHKSEDNHVIKRRFVHPKEKDLIHIAKMKKSFKMAGLANRIRKGNDDDLAMVLPALIPIPQAFDGNSQTISHTGQNIIFNLKKNMVLSDIGYTPQTVVPLYVRSTLMEKEGTSLHGDPTQEEMALDRRYAHYLGRPLVRFNPAEAVQELQDSMKEDSSLMSSGSSLKTTSTYHQKKKKLAPISESPSKMSATTGFLKNDLSALNESFSQTMRSPSLSTIGKEQEKFEYLDKKTRKEIKQLQEERKEKNVPISGSLVRLAFKKEPDLEDLKYLADEF